MAELPTSRSTERGTAFTIKGCARSCRHYSRRTARQLLLLKITIFTLPYYCISCPYTLFLLPLYYSPLLAPITFSAYPYFLLSPSLLLLPNLILPHLPW